MNMTVGSKKEKSMYRAIGALFLCIFSLPLHSFAQDKAMPNSLTPSSGWNQLSGEKLEALNLKGDPVAGGDAFKICQGCHRNGAMGTPSGAYPRLAGQHASVLIEQITDIRSGVRKNPKMEPYSDEHVLSIQEIADIAAYLQAVPIQPNALGIGPGNALAKGESLYLKDCAVCHGAKGLGDTKKFIPLIAGQYYKYILRELAYMQDGKRGNANPDMVEVVKKYSKEDLESVADFVSRMPIGK